MKNKSLIVFVTLLILVASCDYFQNSDTLDLSSVKVSLFGLPSIPDTMTYVGWFDSDDLSPEKVFVLDADQSGNIVYESEKPLKSLHRAQEFVITVERKSNANDSNLVLSTRKILAGRFSNAASNLLIGEGITNFSNVIAEFNLATPTNRPDAEELSGIWFLDSINAPVAGLKLPVLYSGWIYEGWVEINSKLVSTGRFSDPKKADLFSAYGGDSTGYNFPGEDFIKNAPAGLTFPTNLSGAKVYVSIEYKDGRSSGSNPFIIILETTIPASAQSGVTYTLGPSSKALTSGNAIMTIDLVK